MFGFIKKLFPSKHEKDVNSILPIVEEINKYYEEFESLSDEQIIAKTAEFKQRINSETEETRNQINALQEKLKEDIEHNERQDIYDEMEKLEKENYEVTKAVLDDILPEAFAVVKQT